MEMTEERFDALWKGARRNVAGVIAAHSKGATAEDRADLLQDARIKAWKARDQYKPEHPFASWVCVVARNLCRDRFRSRRKAAARPAQLLSEDHHAAIADHGASPFDLATADEIPTEIREAIARLCPRHRTAFALHVGGKTYDEIAEAMKCPVGSAKSRVHRATVRLRELLKTRP